MWTRVPKDVGGAELRPVEVVSLLERISHAHALAGWCTMVNNMEGITMAIYLDQKGIDTVFADRPRCRDRTVLSRMREGGAGLVCPIRQSQAGPAGHDLGAD